MKSRKLICVAALTLFAVVPTALASTTWYVDGANGSDSNNCKTRLHACKTIGHAISLAHSGDSIMVAAAIYKENLSIGISLKIVGSGAKTTILDGGGVGTVVTISKKYAHVTLSRVTIRNGLARFGGGIHNSGTVAISNSTVSGNSAKADYSAAGGGINNEGTLTINDSTVSSNKVTANFAGGGGINNSGTVTISNSTVSGNSVAAFRSGCGGGICNGGTLTISKSTISGNNGLGIDNHGTATVNNSTLSGNIGSGIANGGTTTINNSTLSGNIGDIVNVSGTATLQNSIVANSTYGGNCSGTMTSNGYNLSSDNTCNFNNTGDLNNTDPKLGQLGNHGGPTQTLPLLSGSPAIDAGNPNGCTDGNGHLLKTDQRGKPRPDKEDTGGCDMGAYERQKD
jgi:hypothetical protein